LDIAIQVHAGQCITASREPANALPQQAH